jgi:hypothetical protein
MHAIFRAVRALTRAVNLLLLSVWLWLGIEGVVSPLLAAAGAFATALPLLNLRSSGSTTPRAVDSAAQRLDELMRRPAGARRNATRDEVSGLFNGWYLETRIQQEARRCTRYNLSMAVLKLSALSQDTWQSEASLAAQRAATWSVA